MRSWTCDDVTAWFSQQGVQALGQLCATLRINGAVLLSLTPSEIVELKLGVDIKTSVVLRDTIEKGKRACGQGSVPAVAAAPLTEPLVQPSSSSTSDHSFTCPITHEIMEDPVVAADGFTSERSAIEEWLARHDTSPITREVLSTKASVRNFMARSLIAEWRAAHPQ